MKLISIASMLCLALFSGFTPATEQTKDCSLMHKGIFTYGDEKNPIKVTIKGENHTEYHGKYRIKSTIKWINECEYEATLVEATIPDFPFKPGEVMNVKITKVEDKDIFYTSVVNGESWSGKFKKIK
ncbi:MAG: hypothetical protein ACK4ND_06545 [Cytophagaceae bacterium]